MRRGRAHWPAALAGLLLAGAGAAGEPAAPGIASLLVLDGTVLRSEAASVPHAPASLAKLLTALVVLEAQWQPDHWLRADAAVATAEPARVGLRAGDELRAGDALTAMLVHSANDACLLLVASVRGGRPAFIARMNQRAAALGMQHSHFADPCGFDAPGQYATAEDLLRLAQAAWQLPAVRAAAGLSAGSVRTRAGRELRFTSSNALLGRVPGVIGLKTGYTQQAGPCVIAVAQRDGHLLWLVLLGATDRWWRADALIRAALAG